MSDVIEVVVTSPIGWMKPFVEEVMAERLVACAHQSVIETTYRWQGRVHQAREDRAAMHTTPAALEELVGRVRDRHPFEVPCVMWTVVMATPEYAIWVRSSTGHVSEPDRPASS